jgi:NADH-quinone oxidoreductase subunit K
MDDVLLHGPTTLAAYLLVAAVLFAAGVAAAALRRSAIGVLLGLELMFNAAALQMVAYGRFRPGVAAEGDLAALAIIVVAAAEAAVALALLHAVYRRRHDIDLDQCRELRQ